MMRCCLSPWHSPDPILSPHHLCCQYTPCLHNCNSLIWNFCLDNIRACVSRAGDCIAIDSSHWGARCGYQLSVSDRSLGLISLTILITTHNTNQTHVEFCPTNPTPMNCVFFCYTKFSNMESCCAGPTLTPPRIWQMLKTTQSISPSSHLMIRMTNIILYLRLVVGCYASIIESSCKINCIPNHNIMFHDGMWPLSHSNDWKGWQTRCYFPWLGTERERCKSYGRGETCKETS